MVSPVGILAAFLLFAFLYPLVEKMGRGLAAAIGAGLALAVAVQAVVWLPALAAGGAPVAVDTAGFAAPLSIRLSVGLAEAAALVVVNLIAAVSVIFLAFHASPRWKGRQMMLLFVMLLGANGLIMTRDVFNVFVFMEISAISLFGVLSTSREPRVYEAGFKYMIAGGIASVFYLVGTILLYRFTGTLSLDEMTGIPVAEIHGTAGVVAVGFFLVAILVELKPIPANGWALDTYEAADGGVGALLSAVATTAMVVVLLKVLPLVSAAAGAVATVVPVVGAVSFLGASIMALPQKKVRRMLGLSTVSQTGLVLLVAGSPALAGAGPGAASDLGAAALAGMAGPYAVAVILLLNHALAKAILFWVSEIAGLSDTSSEASLRRRPLLLIVAGIAVFALLGLPPFPAFWAKWAALSSLASGGAWVVVAIVLLGSLLEAGYLGRWFLRLAREPRDSFAVVGEEVPADRPPVPVDAAGAGMPTSAATAAREDVVADSPAPGRGVVAIPALVAVLLLAGGLALAVGFGVSPVALAPIAGILVFALFDLVRLPQKLQALLGLAALAAAGWWVAGNLSGMALLFAAMFLGGTALVLVAFLSRRGRGDGTVAMVVTLALALSTLVTAATRLELFLAWEMMTLASLVLVAKGMRAGAGAVRYLLFSLLSAYALLAALLLVPAWSPADGIASLGPAALGSPGGAVGAAAVPTGGVVALVLLAVAALVKLGSVGVHVWLPATYAEAPDDVSPIFSAVLSKAGLFLFLLAGTGLAVQLVPGLGGTALGGIPVSGLVGWIGVATALAGSLMALFQEDIKYSLAYSSMGQIGYMVLAFSMLTHLGHVTGLYQAVIHLMVKAALWLAILGVVQRTGTRLMYKMGGLIKRMPVTFISVLFGIIVVSGVPPLAGFGGKWLLYTALLEEGWYLQAGLAFFASAVAFLYLYRLIHSIFLGQPKDEFAHVKEAPFVQLLPQLLLLGGLMAVSMFPNLLIVPLQEMVEPLFASTVTWEGYEVISSLGYWNGNAVMYVTMGVFLAPLAWLLIVNGRKVTSVKQFNIVYAAERPYKPETTHYAFNFFGHYQKALGFLVKPWGERLWTGVGRLGTTIGDGLRRWNTGNPQTYGFQILLFLVVILIAVLGGMA